MRFTEENIQTLKDNEIFVFGSNMLGKHNGGAAKVAKDNFGAEDGVYEGITGQCYAIPTLDKNYKKVSYSALALSFFYFVDYAKSNKDKVFLLTKVGLGIAGFSLPEILVTIVGLKFPSNVILPQEFYSRAIHCCGCNEKVLAKLVKWSEIYPYLKEQDKVFYKCPKCGNYVGTHADMEPLGCIPTEEMRIYRKRIHSIIDEIWKNNILPRKKVYKLMGEYLGMDKPYHTGELNTKQDCIRAYEAACKMYTIYINNIK